MDFDITPLLPIGSVGGLVVLMFIGLFRGWVTVKPVVDSIEKDRDYWRQAFFEEQAAHGETVKQIANLDSVYELQRNLLLAARDVYRDNNPRGAS